mgnify:CR=1 FL=1
MAFAAGLEVVEDRGLLAEVAGLVEWPVVLMGEIGADFLDLPAEVRGGGGRILLDLGEVRNLAEVRVNGEAIERLHLTHDELVAGAEVVFVLGPEPALRN